uniref:Uncharacterized protein n=1 Tax=Chrysotila carterae TaxID=13221 RepID=A0A7S4BDG3_CHRCT
MSAASRTLFAPSPADTRLLQSMQQVNKLLTDYVRAYAALNMTAMHSSHRFTAEGHRSTLDGSIIGAYGCPLQFGNRMHEFLNSFAVAVATDRTILWRWSGKNPQDECDRLLHRRNWVAPANELKVDKDFNLYYQDTPLHLACLPLRVGDGPPGSPRLDSIFLGHVQWHQAAALAFSTSPVTAHRGSQLFSAGADFAYGSLFHRSFYWDASAVVLPTLRALQQAGAISSYKHIFNSTYHHSTVSSNYQIPSSLRTDWSAPWIGVHMRHFGAGDDGTRASAISVWWQQIRSHIDARAGPKSLYFREAGAAAYTTASATEMTAATVPRRLSAVGNATMEGKVKHKGSSSSSRVGKTSGTTTNGKAGAKGGGEAKKSIKGDGSKQTSKGASKNTPKSTFSRAPRCALLVASDRIGAINSLRPLAESEGCVLVDSPRADVGSDHGDWLKEHGNFTDTVAMRDLYLLSLADSLVGTAGSSFTLAIAGQLAARYTPGRSLPVLTLCAGGGRGALHCGDPAPLIVDARPQQPHPPHTTEKAKSSALHTRSASRKADGRRLLEETAAASSNKTSLSATILPRERPDQLDCVALEHGPLPIFSASATNATKDGKGDTTPLLPTLA